MTLMTVVRYAVFGLVLLAAIAAFAAMAVQRRTINPFGRPARAIRDMTDPVIKPLERQILRRGGNPQNAPLWLLGIALVLGILLVTVIGWLHNTALELRGVAHGGPGMIAATLVNWAIGILMIALLIRVIGSWFGQDRHSRWMRPFYLLTDWMLKPLGRIIPPLGPIDITPIVAWFILSLLRPFLVNLVARL